MKKRQPDLLLMSYSGEILNTGDTVVELRATDDSKPPHHHHRISK